MALLLSGKQTVFMIPATLSGWPKNYSQKLSLQKTPKLILLICLLEKLSNALSSKLVLRIRSGKRRQKSKYKIVKSQHILLKLIVSWAEDEENIEPPTDKEMESDEVDEPTEIFSRNGPNLRPCNRNQTSTSHLCFFRVNHLTR